MSRAAVAALALPFLAGCTLFSKTEVVREREAERSVMFETVEAEVVFREAVKSRPAELVGTQVGGDLVTLFAYSKQLSEAARFNDAVLLCDANRDGEITWKEAVRFAQGSK